MSEQYPKVSVIVPVYNVEEYIERCVRSLMEQTLEDIEYIFVNDCTPDRSMQILRRLMEEYPQRRKQVKMVEHAQNCGSATVRNSGLKVAVGEYIIHCDSDDWVEPEMYEKLYNKAVETGADMVGCDCYLEQLHSSHYYKQIYPESGKECIHASLCGRLHCGVWSKLVRKGLYEEHAIRFPDGINMWEDVVTSIRLYYFAGKIAYVPDAFYHYVQYNTNSYTHVLSRKSAENMISAVDRLVVFFKGQHAMEPFHISMNYLKLTVKVNLLLNSGGKQQKEWNRLYKEANGNILSHPAMSRYWRLALLFAAGGLLSVFNLLAAVGKKIKK